MIRLFLKQHLKIFKRNWKRLRTTNWILEQNIWYISLYFLWSLIESCPYDSGPLQQVISVSPSLQRVFDEWRYFCLQWYFVRVRWRVCDYTYCDWYLSLASERDHYKEISDSQGSELHDKLLTINTLTEQNNQYESQVNDLKVLNWMMFPFI